MRSDTGENVKSSVIRKREAEPLVRSQNRTSMNSVETTQSPSVFAKNTRQLIPFERAVTDSFGLTRLEPVALPPSFVTERISLRKRINNINKNYTTLELRILKLHRNFLDLELRVKDNLKRASSLQSRLNWANIVQKLLLTTNFKTLVDEKVKQSQRGASSSGKKKSVTDCQNGSTEGVNDKSSESKSRLDAPGVLQISGFEKVARRVRSEEEEEEDQYNIKRKGKSESKQEASPESENTRPEHAQSTDIAVSCCGNIIPIRRTADNSLVAEYLRASERSAF